MYRRQFIKAFAAAFAGFTTSSVAQVKMHLPDQTRPKLLQISPIAGFQYYQGNIVWPRLVQGQLITLQREPTNTHDARAVAVYWEQQKLGFIPRLDNAAISQLLDRGEILVASIYSLAESDNPWERVEVEVRWTI